MLLVLTGCDGAVEHAPAEPIPGAVCPDWQATASADPDTVVVIVTDTTRRDFLGRNHAEWDTTPTIDAFIDEGVLLDRVVATRSLTSVALTSVLTGAYPRTHKVRTNDGSYADPATPTLHQRFQAAGYHTYGMSANMCQLIEVGIDDPLCVTSDTAPRKTQPARDAALVPELFARMDARSDARVYAWVHFMDAHDPYSAVEPYFSEFHPEPYEGPIDPPSEATLARVSAGEIVLTDADRRFLEAVYASQVRGVDDRVAELLSGLAARGRLENSAILFLMDHGDELADHTNYFYHGCSARQSVLGVSAALRAPGRLAAGEVLASNVSSVDLAPTLLEVAGLPFDGPGEGRSLAADLESCTEPERTALFERGEEAAGVVFGGWKYFYDPREQFASCLDYDAEHPFPGQEETLHDLEMDPTETEDLASSETGRAAAMRAMVCGWVGTGTWGTGSNGTALTVACEG